MQRNRHTSVDESHYRVRQILGTDYYTSRIGFDGASLVVRRFPCSGVDRFPPDFVLIHGIGVSSNAYGPTAVMLAEKGNVHLLDLAGYGSAPKPNHDMSIADHAELVSRYIAKKGLDHPIVVGHSMGTQVVAELAANHPDQVDHIVLIAPVMTPDTRNLWDALRVMVKDGWHEYFPMMVVAGVDYLFRSGLPYSLSQIPHLLQTRLEDIAPNIQAKTLVICGESDPVSPPEWGQHLTSLLTRAGFTTVPGPHGAMWVTPKMLAAHIYAHASR